MWSPDNIISTAEGIVRGDAPISTNSWRLLAWHSKIVHSLSCSTVFTNFQLHFKFQNEESRNSAAPEAGIFVVDGNWALPKISYSSGQGWAFSEKYVRKRVGSGRRRFWHFLKCVRKRVGSFHFSKHVQDRFKSGSKAGRFVLLLKSGSKAIQRRICKFVRGYFS